MQILNLLLIGHDEPVRLNKQPQKPDITKSMWIAGILLIIIMIVVSFCLIGFMAPQEHLSQVI